MITRVEFAKALLRELGYPIHKRNLWALVSWMQAEGSVARFNPLATTKKMFGSRDFNSVGVQHYTSFQQGVSATAQTLKENQQGYSLIRSRLQRAEFAYLTLRAVEDSCWGTGGLALRCLRWVKRSWRSYADKPIGQ